MNLFTEVNISQKGRVWIVVILWSLITIVSACAFIFSYAGYTKVGNSTVTESRFDALGKCHAKLDCETKDGQKFSGYIVIGMKKGDGHPRRECVAGYQEEILYPANAIYKEEPVRVYYLASFKLNRFVVIMLIVLEGLFVFWLYEQYKNDPHEKYAENDEI